MTTVYHMYLELRRTEHFSTFAFTFVFLTDVLFLVVFLFFVFFLQVQQQFLLRGFFI